MSETTRGLEGVVVGRTAMSKVFGEEGNLIYRGVSIHDLATHSNFEEVVFLLWNGCLPKRAELETLRRQMVAARAVPRPVLEYIRQAPADDSMATLRTATSMLSGYDPDAEDYSLAAVQRKALRLTSCMATLVAAIGRARDGHDALTPNANLGHAASFLHMLMGREPDAVAARILDQALVLHADHGFNASTFTARITTSTLSDLHSAIVAALGTLKGASHGGANCRVMEMLAEIDASGADPEAWVLQSLANEKRIMGFGHRVYKVEDPRATHLRRASQTLAQRTGVQKWYAMSERIEKTVRTRKGLYPNVDFYSASTYHMLGIPMHLFTPIFALSRVGGWTAHAIEQAQDNRLIRPRSEYIGPSNVAYTPLDKRDQS